LDALENLENQIRAIKHALGASESSKLRARTGTVASKSDLKGILLSCGLNSRGQLGTGSYINRTKFEKSAKVQKLPMNTIHVCAGFHHTMALTSDGEVYVFGGNDSGQCGFSKKPQSSYNEPRKITYFDTNRRVKLVTAGESFSIALTHDGHVYSWGGNKFGQLGLSHVNNRYAPEELGFLSNRYITQIVAGSNHVLALSEDNELYSWGYVVFVGV